MHQAPASTGSPVGRPGAALRRIFARGAGPAERRTEWMLRTLAAGVLVVIAGMAITVFQKAWPSFAHNGLAWFGGGGDVDQQLEDIFNSPANPSDYVYTLHAWPLLWGTAVVTALAVIVGIAFSLLSAIFIV